MARFFLHKEPYDKARQQVPMSAQPTEGNDPMRPSGYIKAGIRRPQHRPLSPVSGQTPPKHSKPLETYTFRNIGREALTDFGGEIPPNLGHCWSDLAKSWARLMADW